ncbi:Uma2 family endonuclease [Neorhodopirellula pilleata]|uniref:Putative restriction endonuclease domain-containing protein n=1 Tax=Neorhodopirellula pilleata TaxID=2714738 RepID=A0A5C5ZLF1_9BACT|nr:Uma2 family endonuclease [Neorhodopirellula pilleata]TWT88028.1 hypothetical protein Pla100_57590 [Neorhodopirellula pilleata]
MSHATLIETFAERLVELGGVDPARVRLTPAPGTSTLEDLIKVNHHEDTLCELVDRTLVEKAMSYEASVVAMTIARILGTFVSFQRLGIVSGPDGMFRLLPGNVRGPDVGYVSRLRFPEGRFPTAAYPSISPDLAVEVLSPGNTKAEMTRKRIEYFHSGVKLVWIVDCRDRSVAVYTAPDEVVVLNEGDTIDGGEVLPEFSVCVAEFFSDLELLDSPSSP